MKKSMNPIPFPEIHQLDDQLQLDHSKEPIELCCVDHSCKSLPGQPRVRLDRVGLDIYLKKDLSLPELNQLAPKLWLVHIDLFLQTMLVETDSCREGLHASKLTHLATASSGCQRTEYNSDRESAVASSLVLQSNIHQTYSKILAVICVLAIS